MIGVQFQNIIEQESQKAAMGQWWPVSLLFATQLWIPVTRFTFSSRTLCLASMETNQHTDENTETYWKTTDILFNIWPNVPYSYLLFIPLLTLSCWINYRFLSPESEVWKCLGECGVCWQSHLTQCCEMSFVLSMAILYTSFKACIFFYAFKGHVQDNMFVTLNLQYLWL